MKIVLEYQPWEEFPYAAFWDFTPEELSLKGAAATADAYNKMLYPEARFQTEEEGREWCLRRTTQGKRIAEYPLEGI